MIKVNLNSLLNSLKKNYQAELQEQTNQIYIILKIEDREFPLFIRIFDQSEHIQLLAFMPCQVKLGTENDLARLLHLINKELDIPGFGMDENAHVVFYRFMLPAPGKEVDEGLLDSYLKSIKLICESLSASVIAVATGLTTYEEILKQAIQSSQKNQIKP